MAVVTMRATRDALRRLVAQDSWEKPYANAALAEVEAVEAVVEAARASAAAWPPENSPRWRWPFRWPYFYVTYGPRARAILDALARLDALTDGQTEGDHRAEHSAHPGETASAAPSACPCDGTDCVC